MSSRCRFHFLLIFLCLAAALPSAGHIGSPDVFYDGQAGPWPLRVIVRSPGVVPGLAEISVRVQQPGVREVRVRPVRWDLDLEGAPPADVARTVRGDSTLWNAELWFMTSGSYSVYVEVEGEAGTGMAIVPVHSVATRKLEMSPWMGALLLALGILLVAGFARLAGAGVESVLEPGAEPDAALKRRARRAMALAFVLICAVLYGGKSWWDNVDVEYLQGLWSALSTSAEMRPTADGPRILDLHLDDERFQRSAPLVPDHGKLMHMFLIREPSLDAFAHLHPVRVEELQYSIPLPHALPAGNYRIYADITNENGIAQTLTTTVDVSEAVVDPVPPPENLEPDLDDSWHVASPQEGAVHRFQDGTTLTSELTLPLRAKEEVVLSFSLRDAQGAPAQLEPYMGMLSHAAVRRHDGEVFIHLHPTGTVSMASRQLSQVRDAERRGEPLHAPAMDHGAMGHREETMDHQTESVDHQGMDHGEMGPMSAAEPGRVSMPYAFPRPGTYRLWVQVKSLGQVYTGVFDAEVGEAL